MHALLLWDNSEKGTSLGFQKEQPTFVQSCNHYTVVPVLEFKCMPHITYAHIDSRL